MALSDKRILEEIERGNILVHPWDPSCLSTSSLDVRLGRYYYRQIPSLFPVYNIWSEDHTARVWGEPQKALSAKNVLAHIRGFKFGEGIEPDDAVILINPGETILGHTEEFVGGMNVITTKMQARSSLGRSGIEVCKCAGWGDVGYVNRWTMEITNNSKHYHIPLVVGRRIAQLIFFETGPILDKNYAHSGKYQTTTDIKKLKKDWNPLSMLPKLYLDRDIKKKNM